jgi:magnesium-protoporphyrin O-methyltransferase
VQTKLLLQAIRSLRLRQAELLDIGGGIGAIHHELLEDAVQTATHVDASSAYLQEAKAEAARRGHGRRVRFIHADFIDVASDLLSVDIVTLDRVVCCYPDFRRLLKAAAEHSRHALAFTYPRETWYLRMGLRIINWMHCFKRRDWNGFLFGGFLSGRWPCIRGARGFFTPA